jgi:hypothetical protein
MPFVFEAEHVAVCGRLELSSRSGDHASELVARRIVELAIAGERNADRLIVRTLADFGVGNDGWLCRHRLPHRRVKRGSSHSVPLPHVTNPS